MLTKQNSWARVADVGHKGLASLLDHPVLESRNVKIKVGMGRLVGAVEG